MSVKERISWRVLHIDDDEEDHIIVRAMLREAQGQPISIYWVSTLDDARRLISSQSFDVLLVDYDLGVSSGIDLIRELSGQGCTVPMILLTGRGSYEVDVEAMHAGATLYLTKNEINPLLLERSIRYAIEQKRTEARLRLSEEKFSIIFDRSPTPTILMSSPGNRFIDVNQAYLDLTGYEKDEVIGKTSIELGVISDAEKRSQTIEDLHTYGYVYGVEARSYTKQGDVRITTAHLELIDIEGQQYILGTVEDITERKKVEQALRASEERFRLAVRSSNDAIWDWDIKTDTIHWNEAMTEVFGYPPEEQVNSSGDWWKSRIHPEDAPRVVRSVHQVIYGGGEVWSEEYRFQKADSSYAEVIDRGSVIRDEQDNPVRMVGAMRDVSPQKEIEQVLRKSEARLRQLADAMPQLVWTAQPDGVVDYYNERYHLYGGISPVDFERWDWGPVLHPDDLQKTVDAWQYALETGTTYQVEHRVRMADGSYRWHLSRGIPGYDDQGELIKWYGTATDIHDFKQIQETLELRERRMSRLFDANLIGILSREPSGRVLEANDAFLEITGRTRAEIEQGLLSIHDITPTEYRWLDDRCTEEVLAYGICKTYEKEYQRKDGTRIPVMIGYSLFDNKQPELIGFVLDLSELKKAQASLAEYTEKLKRSNEELESFAFVASHDLQEPLRKIQMFSDSLRKQLHGQLNEEAEDYLSRMKNAAGRMQAMVEGLLDLSRVNTHDRVYETVDMTRLAEEVVSDLEMRIEASGGQVSVDPLPAVKGDPLQLRQLLQNLIGNGLKFHQEGVPPHVRVRVDGRMVGKSKQATIVVEDNGIGFDPANADRIFQPFVRLHGRSSFEGSGIGLTICRKIVEGHGGKISANSQPGKGSQILVTLPRA